MKKVLLGLVTFLMMTSDGYAKIYGLSKSDSALLKDEFWSRIDKGENVEKVSPLHSKIFNKYSKVCNEAIQKGKLLPYVGKKVLIYNYENKFYFIDALFKNKEDPQINCYIGDFSGTD